MVVNIILIGAQGSGKGTQAAKLSHSLNVCHISSGDLFRQAFAEKTALGLQAQAYVDRGELVPDSITVAMVLERIQQPDCLDGILLDGFPRTIAQAQALDSSFERIGQHIDHAVYLSVPRETLLERLSGRYICRAHQHVYNINTQPSVIPGRCDIDGSELYQRADDKGEAVQKRLDIFFNETIQLLDYYSVQEKLVKVDGNQPIEDVHHDILQLVTNLRNTDEHPAVQSWQLFSLPQNTPGQLSAGQ
jgi:adenylate kinase